MHGRVFDSAKLTKKRGMLTDTGFQAQKKPLDSDLICVLTNGAKAGLAHDNQLTDFNIFY